MAMYRRLLSSLMVVCAAITGGGCGADYAEDGSSGLSIADTIESAGDDERQSVAFSITNTLGTAFRIVDATIILVGDSDQDLIAFEEITLDGDTVTSEFDDLTHLWARDAQMTGAISVPTSLLSVIALDEAEILVMVFETANHEVIHYDYNLGALSVEEADDGGAETAETSEDGDVDGSDDVVEGDLD